MPPPRKKLTPPGAQKVLFSGNQAKMFLGFFFGPKWPKSCKFPHEIEKNRGEIFPGLSKIRRKNGCFVGVLTAFSPKGSSGWPVIC
jgi:hypothetical protein